MTQTENLCRRSPTLRPFWSGAKQGKLMVQKAAADVQFLSCPARRVREPRPEVVEPNPTARCLLTVAYAVMMNHPDWKEDLP
jgi:hypothetical protein